MDMKILIYYEGKGQCQKLFLDKSIGFFEGQGNFDITYKKLQPFICFEYF